MPEYGRGIQTMVDMAVRTENRSERQRQANTIVRIMAALMPSAASKEDNEHRLWNHLARISHYQLDIDYPVNIVPQEEVQAHPEPLPYPMKSIKRRHYGYLVQQGLDFAAELEDKEMQQSITKSIANQMKQDLFIWNRDSMDNALVAQDVGRLSGGRLSLDLENFTFNPVGAVASQHPEGGKKRKKKK